MYDLSLVAEDADVLYGGIVFPEGQYLGLVWSDGYWSAIGGYGDEHIFVIESIEPLAEGILGKDISFIFLLAIELIPLIIHCLYKFIISIWCGDIIYLLGM